MNRDDFSDLRLDMVCAYKRWYHDSIRPDYQYDRNIAALYSEQYRFYGGFLDQIRLGIEVRGYNRSAQHDLNIILRLLREVGEGSTLVDKLQNIIDSLGEPV